MAQYIEPFRCDITEGPDHVVVAPRGELDMATVGAVQLALERVRKSGPDRVVLDLSGLSFMDSTGLHLASRWASESARDGFEFEIVQGGPNVKRVFDLAEMTTALPFRDAQ